MIRPTRCKPVIGKILWHHQQPFEGEIDCQCRIDDPLHLRCASTQTEPKLFEVGVGLQATAQLHHGPLLVYPVGGSARIECEPCVGGLGELEGGQESEQCGDTHSSDMVKCSFFSLALQRSSSAIAMIDPCWKCDEPAEQAVHGHSQQWRLPRRIAERRCTRPECEKARHSVGTRRLLIVSQMAMRAWHKVRGRE